MWLSERPRKRRMQLTISFREGEPKTYTKYEDMEADYVSAKVKRERREGRGWKSRREGGGGEGGAGNEGE